MTGKFSIRADELVRLEETENASKKTTLSMKECVSRFAETSTGNSAVVVSNIHSIWEQIVGVETATHVQVRHVRNGVLHVLVDHPAWGTQLKYMQENIIEQLKLAVPNEKIESIVMTVSRTSK